MSSGSWSLPSALAIGEPPGLVAIVGGGGKTSLMFALAADLPGRVVMTTTTRIFAAQMQLAPVAIQIGELSSLAAVIERHGRCLIVSHIEGDKAIGISPDLPSRLLTRSDVDYVLVEADGSRTLSLKAPADHEPVIPSETMLLVPMAGLDALEGPLDEVAHRPQRIRAIMNDSSRPHGNSPHSSEVRPPIVDGRLTPAGLARLLTHPHGGLKNAPPVSRIVPFLNKVETTERLAAAREAARLMLADPRVSRVVLAALKDDQPVKEVWRRTTAVVLAAGESSRMGRNKLSLPWRDGTVLGQTLANVKASSVADILVVTGHDREEAEAGAAQLKIPTLHNEGYANGMLTSVQTAIRSLPSSTDAALIILGDQPLVGPDIFDALLQAYAECDYGLIVPTHHGRRGNPVLIDRRYFAELLALPPEAAPRALLQHHPQDIFYVALDDDAVLHDLDRPEDYERLRPR